MVIADDHRLILDGVRRALESDGGFEIVGETMNGTEVIHLVERRSPTSWCSTSECPSWTASSVSTRCASGSRT